MSYNRKHQIILISKCTEELYRYFVGTFDIYPFSKILYIIHKNTILKKKNSNVYCLVNFQFYLFYILTFDFLNKMFFFKYFIAI